MRLTIKELRRLVYEAVHQAKGARKRAEKEFKGVPAKDRFGGLGLYDAQYDLSQPPPGGGRLKRQGAVSSSPAITSEARLRHLIRGVVREALRRGR